MRVVERLNEALAELLANDPNVLIMGEDVLSPYGGAFKVSKGLSEQFPDRVLTTPISEAGIVGVATGMALRGKKPIVEIMFGDFLTLCMDQLINHAAKLRWMYNEQVSVPLVVRTPMGGRRGYGPTHSQSLEKHFCGVPGLTVMAINQYEDPGKTLADAVALGSPVVLIENKVLYARQVEPEGKLSRPARPEAVIVTYGGSVEIAQKAAAALAADEEIEVEVLPVTQLSPFPYDIVRDAARRAPAVLALEEGVEGWGFASECARALVNNKVRFASLAAPAHPIPSSGPWETAILPSADGVVAAVLELLDLD